jgi:hypothetical protein
MNDEIIRALHATKEHLAEEAGLDIKQLIENIRHEEAISVKQGRVVLQPATGNVARSVFQQIRFANH